MDQSNSLLRILKFFLMIFFTIQIKKIIQKYPVDFEKIIFGFWLIIFSIVLVDVVFEITFGFNTLGFESGYYPVRIASFFGDELVVGAYFLGFGLFYIGKMSHLLKQHNKLLISIILIVIFVSLLIGERSNFIKFFIGSSILLFFVTNINFKKAVLILGLFLLTFFALLNFNEQIKYKYKSQFLAADVGGINDLLKSSLYIAHYDAAYKIFQEYPVFGIGIKNFRSESRKDKYRNDKLLKTNSRGSTHPHQIHFEILSETGLFGYISFVILIVVSLSISIKNYFKQRNIYQLSSIVFIITFIIPFLPSGSFFSTFTAALFWINYAIMMGYNKN
ncbi:O-antigen ligase family protein [Pelagibacterales bacterium SAG-MED20]|nr:O-antigen ligase family protein [Pelagibacterales bacterium SAG-MED20]